MSPWPLVRISCASDSGIESVDLHPASDFAFFLPKNISTARVQLCGLFDIARPGTLRADRFHPKPIERLHKRVILGSNIQRFKPAPSNSPIDDCERADKRIHGCESLLDGKGQVGFHCIAKLLRRMNLITLVFAPFGFRRRRPAPETVFQSASHGGEPPIALRAKAIIAQFEHRTAIYCDFTAPRLLAPSAVFSSNVKIDALSQFIAN